MFNWLTRWFRHDNEQEQIDRLSKETKKLQTALTQTQDELHRLRLLENVHLSNGRSHQYKTAEVSFVDPMGTKEITIMSAAGLLTDAQKITLNEAEAKQLLNILEKYFGEND